MTSTTFHFDSLIATAPPPGGIRVPRRVAVAPFLAEDGEVKWRATLFDLMGEAMLYAVSGTSPETAARGVMLTFYGLVSKVTGKDTTDDAARMVRLTLN